MLVLITTLILVAQQDLKIIYMANLNLDEGLDAIAINKKKNCRLELYS